MKKAYMQPIARKIDFEYDEQITAQSVPPMGEQIRPDHPTLCQYFASWGTCHIMVVTGYMCKVDENNEGTV